MWKYPLERILYVNTKAKVTIRILIVDDHPVVCSGLTSMLSAQTGLEVVGSAASGEEALTIVQRDRPDIMLLDLRMPGMDGINVLNALERMEHSTRVVVLTSFEKRKISTGRFVPELRGIC